MAVVINSPQVLLLKTCLYLKVLSSRVCHHVCALCPLKEQVVSRPEPSVCCVLIFTLTDKSALTPEASFLRYRQIASQPLYARQRVALSSTWDGYITSCHQGAGISGKTPAVKHCRARERTAAVTASTRPTQIKPHKIPAQMGNSHESPPVV